MSISCVLCDKPRPPTYKKPDDYLDLLEESLDKMDEEILEWKEATRIATTREGCYLSPFGRPVEDKFCSMVDSLDEMGEGATAGVIGRQIPAVAEGVAKQRVIDERYSWVR